MLERGTHPLPFFWKCVKRKGFKSFVLKVCDSKGFAGAFLRKCINLKGLHDSEGSFGSRCSLRTTIPGWMVVLKVCETKGVANAFLGNCVKRKSLGGILASFQVLAGAAVFSGSLAATLSDPSLTTLRGNRSRNSPD